MGQSPPHTIKSTQYPHSETCALRVQGKGANGKKVILLGERKVTVCRLRVSELREELKARGADTEGDKAALKTRLEKMLGL